MTVDVMVADDVPLMRQALAAGVEADPRLHIVAAAATGRELLDALVERECDVAVLDVHLPDTDGIELIRRIRRLHPETQVVVLTATERAATVRQALQAGAAGYLLKRQPLDEIVDAICAVCNGGMVVAPQVASRIFGGRRGNGNGSPSFQDAGNEDVVLEPFELDVLRLVVRGATDLEIAHELFVSPRTVQYQLAHIRAKAGVHRRTELARWAFENALV